MKPVDMFRELHQIDEPQHYIYALLDPRTDLIRYIGMSRKPGDRLMQHVGERGPNHRQCWIDELRRIGLRPCMEIIDSVPIGGDWQSVERAYIAGARIAGCDLVNATDGGEGVVNLSADAKERMRRTKAGMKMSDETRAKMSAARRRVKMTPEWCARIAEANRGKLISDAQRLFIRDVNQKLTDDQVREIRALIRDGLTQSEIAGRYGVCGGTVSNINIGRTYSHVKDDQ